jgi:hypothetical protein
MELDQRRLHSVKAQSKLTLDAEAKLLLPLDLERAGRQLRARSDDGDVAFRKSFAKHLLGGLAGCTGGNARSAREDESVRSLNRNSPSSKLCSRTFLPLNLSRSGTSSPRFSKPSRSASLSFCLFIIARAATSAIESAFCMPSIHKLSITASRQAASFHSLAISTYHPPRMRRSMPTSFIS